MVRLTSVAFWMASASVAMLFISCILPYWFGRYDDRGVSRNYGLFYRIECSVDHQCRVFDDILDSTTLPINGRSWKVELLAIPVLALLTWIIASFSVIILELIHCGCCKFRVSLHRLIIFCAAMFVFSDILGLLTLFLSFYAADEYYTDKPISRASEFPWCILIMTIAVFIGIIVTIFYFRIVFKWNTYRPHYYSESRRFVEEQKYRRKQESFRLEEKSQNRKPLHNSRLRITDSPMQSRYGVTSFTNTAYGSSSALGNGSLSGYNKTEYFYFPTDLKRSRSASDMELIVSQSEKPLKKSKSDYVLNIDDVMSSRKSDNSKREGSYIKNKPKSSRSGSGNGALRPPSVLDILYRESKKNSEYF